MSISYFVGGRLGNNLCQYFTAKVFCKLLNKKYIFNTKFNFKVTDDNFNSFYENYSESKVDNIFFDGYFCLIDSMVLTILLKYFPLCILNSGSFNESL